MQGGFLPMVMLSILDAVSNTKFIFILLSLIIVITLVDSQFIKVFYGTNFGTPGKIHLLLFISFVVIASIINAIFLLFAKSNDTSVKSSGTLLFRIAYIATSLVQYTITVILFIMITEMLIFHGYNKIFSLLIVYLSHLWSAIILGVLSFRFIQWFRFTRSFSLLIYGVVFIAILFLILITVPLLTEQFRLQPQVVYSRVYTSLIMDILVPSSDIAFIYALGNYVLPLLVILSWIVTVSLLRPYADRIGKKTFWLIVSIPLLYQFFSLIVSDPYLITDPGLIKIVYSKEFQLFIGISHEITGLLLAIGFWLIGRKMKRKTMRNYLIISSIGMILLFSSIQSGIPFYAAYPPFGLVTLLFLGLSSYLLLVGMLGCAAYVSRDVELRREIYRGLEIDSNVLKKMGLAEVQREMERRILPLVNKTNLSDEMRQSLDPSDEDVKTMIDEVLNEIHSKRPHVNDEREP
jgi:hypothetical protein